MSAKRNIFYCTKYSLHICIYFIDFISERLWDIPFECLKKKQIENWACSRAAFTVFTACNFFHSQCATYKLCWGKFILKGLFSSRFVALFARWRVDVVGEYEKWLLRKMFPSLICDHTNLLNGYRSSVAWRMPYLHNCIFGKRKFCTFAS